MARAGSAVGSFAGRPPQPTRTLRGSTNCSQPIGMPADTTWPTWKYTTGWHCVTRSGRATLGRATRLSSAPASGCLPRVRARPGGANHRRLANWLTCRRRLPIFCRRQTAFGLLLRPVAFAYTIAVVLLGAGLLASWAWNAPARPLRRPAELAEGAGQDAAGPRPGGGWHWLSHGWHWLSQWHAGGGWHWLSQWHAGGGWHWLSQWSADGRGWLSQWHAGGRVGHLGRHNPNQRRTRVGAGCLPDGDEGSRSWGRTGSTAPPDAHSAVLAYGRATVQVENGGKFTLQTPFTAVTCSGGEFGIELDRSGEGWIHSFGGAVGLSLHSFRAAVLWFQGARGRRRRTWCLAGTNRSGSGNRRAVAWPR